jgi:hypothetical protein
VIIPDEDYQVPFLSSDLSVLETRDAALELPRQDHAESATTPLFHGTYLKYLKTSILV